MLAQIDQLIILLKSTSNDIKIDVIEEKLRNLLSDTTSLIKQFDEASADASDTGMVTTEAGRASFSNWLNYNRENLLLHSEIALLSLIKRTTETGKKIAPASLYGLKIDIGTLLDKATSKLNQVADSTTFENGKGKGTVLGHLDSIIAIIIAPIARETPIIPEGFDSQFELALKKLEPYISSAREELRKRGEGDTYSCFLSYAWGQTEYVEFVERVYEQLTQAKLNVYYDRVKDVAGKPIANFVAKIDSVDWVVLFGSLLYQRKYNRVATFKAETEHVLKSEVNILNANIMQNSLLAEKIIPIILEGTTATALPQPFFKGKIPIDLNEDCYIKHIVRLIGTLYSIPPLTYTKIYREVLEELPSNTPLDNDQDQGAATAASSDAVAEAPRPGS
jgi:TIR domain